MGGATKHDLVDEVYDRLDLPKHQVRDIVDALFELLKAELANGGIIKLPGFGNFNVRSKHQRVGRNPKTGEEMDITARKVVTFKPSTMLRDRVRNG